MNYAKVIFTNKIFIGGLVVAILYFVIVKPLLSKRSQSLLVDEIQNKPVNSDLTTITSQQANNIANNMYAEMKGVNWSVNSDFWDDVINLVRTRDDEILVIKAFGIRDGETLYQWLKNEVTLRFLPTYQLLLNKFKL